METKEITVTFRVKSVFHPEELGDMLFHDPRSLERYLANAEDDGFTVAIRTLPLGD